MFKRKRNLSAALFVGCVVSIVSCTKNDVTPGIQPYTVPATYTFSNMNNTEASSSVSMWVGLTGYLGKGTTRVLSQDTANYLWNNTNAAFTAEVVTGIPFSSTQLNALSHNIAAKTADQLVFKAAIDSMVKISSFNAANASLGVAGKIGTRLVNHAGLEYNQLVAKGLMGALQLNQVIACLNRVATDDNITVIPGQGTAMEHDWDLAFGYVGIPKDYDSSVVYTSATADRPLAIGGYFRERAGYIQAGGKIFEAFRKGRAAITAKDYAVRDAAIATIKENLEKTIAASCYAYAGIAQTSTDLASKFHAMSEGAGFAIALKYRQASSKLTEANYQLLVNIFKTDFYALAADASHTKLNQAKAILVAAYGQLQAG